MSDQDDHDYRMSKRKTSLGPLYQEYQKSRARLEALLKAKNGASKEPPPLTMLDPIESAIKDNPGLTREKAVRLAESTASKESWGHGLQGQKIFDAECTGFAANTMRIRYTIVDGVGVIRVSKCGRIPPI